MEKWVAVVNLECYVTGVVSVGKDDVMENGRGDKSPDSLWGWQPLQQLMPSRM